MSNMPDKIWASYDDYRTWSLSPYADYQQEYHNTAQLIEWLEERISGDTLDEFDCGWDAAIGMFIKQLKEK